MSTFGTIPTTSPLPAGGSGSIVTVSDNPPTSSDGSDGDFWLANHVLYGPKTSGTWPVAVISG